MFDVSDCLDKLRCRETQWLRARRDKLVREQRRLRAEELAVTRVPVDLARMARAQRIPTVDDSRARRAGSKAATTPGPGHPRRDRDEDRAGDRCR